MLQLNGKQNQKWQAGIGRTQWNVTWIKYEYVSNMKCLVILERLAQSSVGDRKGIQIKGWFQG